jgi:hypothetical protein
MKNHLRTNKIHRCLFFLILSHQKKTQRIKSLQNIYRQKYSQPKDRERKKKDIIPKRK